VTVDERGAEVLSPAECRELLGAAKGLIGHVAFNHGGRVTIRPVDFLLHGEEVLLRLGAGAMLDAIVAEPLVAFEIDDVVGAGTSSPTAWSVLVEGRPRLLREPEELDDAMALGLTPLVPDAGGIYVAIEAEVVSGRRFSVGALARYRLVEDAGRAESGRDLRDNSAPQR
jgi:nitroimidazol reductase NimA-like FMN-containing flavoprotein (pyridoxamine 5'-phosphate oxidase superfamily)